SFEWHYFWRLLHGGGQVLAKYPGSVFALARSPDGRLLAAAGSDRRIHLWSTETWQEIGTLEGHAAGLLALAISPDSKTLASGGNGVNGRSGEVKLWDLTTQKLLGNLEGNASPVCCVAFSPDGKTLAVGGDRVSAGANSGLMLWDITNR